MAPLKGGAISNTRRRALLAGCVLAVGVVGFGPLAAQASVTPAPTLTVVAGAVASGPSLTSQPALLTQFASITAITTDRAGTTYVATSDSTITAVRLNGTARLIAGTPNAVGMPTPGLATSSLLSSPWAMRVDRSGNLYVVDIDAAELLKITPEGTLSIVAGTGTPGPVTPGPATASSLRRPQGVAIDGRGNVYVADTGNRVIEKIAPDGTLSIFAGSGDVGTPQPGAATSSPFQALGGLAVSGGSLYFIDHGARQVGKINLANRTLSIVAGSGSYDFPQPGPARGTGFHDLTGLAVDNNGNVFIADSDNSVVVKVTTAGALSIVAGNGGYGVATPGPATATSLENPAGVAIGRRGNLIIGDANSGNGLLYRVTSDTGTLSVVAGNLPLPLPGAAQNVTLTNVAGVSVDALGNTYAALPFGNVVIKVSPSGVVSVVAGTGDNGAPTPGRATDSNLSRPIATAVDGQGDLYIADQGNAMVEKVSPSGTLSIVAGTGSIDAPGPGLATASPLGYVSAIALDAAGNLFLADASNVVIEKVATNGALSIVAGNGSYGSPTPGPATASSLAPAGIAVDGSDNLFIADSVNAVIEKVTVNGTLSIVAGSGEHSIATPGPATSSPLVYPSAVAVDGSGNLYIADLYGGAQYCGQVEKVSPDGVLSVFAGNGSYGAAIAGPATGSPLFIPNSLVIDPTGSLEVATYFQIIRLDSGTSPRSPRIKTLQPTLSGLQVRWTPPASRVGAITSYVATATDANGDDLGSCTATFGNRVCVITGLPSTGVVSVIVAVNENRVPHAASGMVSFSSTAVGVTLG